MDEPDWKGPLGEALGSALKYLEGLPVRPVGSNASVEEPPMATTTATPAGSCGGYSATGPAGLSGTTWHGQAAMRISVTNWSTEEADVDWSVAAILRCAAGR